MTDRRPPDIFTSLQEPPSPSYIRRLAARGVRTFDFDVTKPGAARSVAAVKAIGGTIVAYHVGGGGGRAWGSVGKGEQVRKFDTADELAGLTAEVSDLVAKGADAVHFDNTHRMSGKRLEAVADAIKAGGAGFIAKNNPHAWGLVMKRRPDLRPDYAVIENAVHDAGETEEAATMAKRGVPTYVVDFVRPIDKGKGQPVSADDATRWQAANPDLRLIHMSNERFYRHGPPAQPRDEADTYSRFRADGSVNPDSIEPADIAPVNPVTGRLRPLARDAANGGDNRSGLVDPWNAPMKLGGPVPVDQPDGTPEAKADGELDAGDSNDAGEMGGSAGGGVGRGGRGKGGKGRGGKGRGGKAGGKVTASGHSHQSGDKDVANKRPSTQTWSGHQIASEIRAVAHETVSGDPGAIDVARGLWHPKSLDYFDGADALLYRSRSMRGVQSQEWPASLDTDKSVMRVRQPKRPPGMMRLGGPAPLDAPQSPIATTPPALSRAKAREQMGHEDVIRQGIPEGTDLYHERMQQMRAGKVPLRERPATPGPRSEGSAPGAASASLSTGDMAGFAAAAHAYHSGHGIPAPDAAGGEGNWTNVREGGRGWANPAVQRAAQAARKAK